MSPRRSGASSVLLSVSTSLALALFLAGCPGGGGGVGERCGTNADCDPGLLCDPATSTCAPMIPSDSATDGGAPPSDAGPGTDAGNPGTDAGNPGTDAGSTGTDAGNPGTDAGAAGCLTNGDCDDADPCTTDTCDTVTGACATPPAPPGTPCDDGNTCDGDEVCDGFGICLTGLPLACDDGSACTTDSCLPATGCANVPLAAGTSCVDATVCNGDEACDGAGACAPGVPLACDDGNDCTTDYCSAVAGCGSSNAPAGASCDDATVCNGLETCDGFGVCLGGIPLFCDDGNICTSDSCDPVTGCSNPNLPAGTGCDDFDDCTFGDDCVAGVCGGSAYSCSDGVVCTADTCLGDGTCTNIISASECGTIRGKVLNAETRVALGLVTVRL